MNNRERILKFLKKEAIDRVPWFGDLDYWYNGLKNSNKLPQKYHGDGYFQLNKDLGIGFYLQGYFPFKPEYRNVEVSIHTEDTIWQRKVETPYGVLSEQQKFLESSSCWAYEEHLVKSINDLKAFRYWIENTSFKEDYDEAERRKDIIGENGIVLCYLPRSPFMEMVAVYSGIENLVYIDMDDSSELKLTLETLEEKLDEAALIAVNTPVDCLMIPENLSSEVVGKNYYLNYMRPYEKRWIERIQEASKFSFIHMDGTLKGLIGDVAETGFDVMEALTPAPYGNIPIEELSDAAGPGPILWGGLPGPFFTNQVDESTFDEFVKQTLIVMRKEPRFVLGVADQVPPDALWERVGKVIELVEQYGRY